jgi:hypothetical protein
MNEYTFNELDSTELCEITGGGGGWIGYLQPAYDFGRGICEGFKSASDEDDN